MPTKIEWTNIPGYKGETWNPVTGCTQISPGCANCYAKKMAETRLRGLHGYPADEPFRPGTIHKKAWAKVYKWEIPRAIFVCSMGDLFHESVTEKDIVYLFHEAIRMYEHTFIFLTKRPERMRQMANIILNQEKFVGAIHSGKLMEDMNHTILPRNLWFGVSAENQETANERIPELLKIKGAAVRFVSVEPMLEHIDLTTLPDRGPGIFNGLLGDRRYHKLSWVICGGETGHHARPMQMDWARSLRDQCQDAQVPFFFKSTGGKDKTDLLDGRTWKEFPNSR